MKKIIAWWRSRHPDPAAVLRAKLIAVSVLNSSPGSALS